MLTSSIRAFAVSYNEQAIRQYCESFIGNPSTYYCTIAYKTPRYPNGFCAISFRFTTPLLLTLRHLLILAH